MDPREVQRIGLQLLGALAYVHERNIIHRSVGTTNVHLASQWDGSEVAKLTGFSLSRDLGAPPSSSFSSPDAEALSEFAHVAPEQIMAPESVDHRTDLYALGVSLYTLLAGVSPFPQTTISELGDAIIHQHPAPLMTHATVPAPLEELVQQALAKRPEERFVDARAFSNALRRALP
jgi:serine/threonine-protein kinase